MKTDASHTDVHSSPSSSAKKSRPRSPEARRRAAKVHAGLGMLLGSIIAGIMLAAVVFAAPGAELVCRWIALAVAAVSITGMFYCRHTSKRMGQESLEWGIVFSLLGFAAEVIAVVLISMASADVQGAGLAAQAEAARKLQVASFVENGARILNAGGGILLVVFLMQLAKGLRNDRLARLGRIQLGLLPVVIVVPVSMLFLLPESLAFLALYAVLGIGIVGLVLQFRLVAGLRQALAGRCGVERETAAWTGAPAT